MTDHQHGSTPGYADWPVDGAHSGYEYLGVTADGRPMFFHPTARAVFEGIPDEERRTISRGEEESLEEPLGQWLDRVGERVGWESLSAFARSRLAGAREE